MRGLPSRQAYAAKNRLIQGKIGTRLAPESATAKVIQAQYPGRVALTPEEVALLLYGTDSRSMAQSVREALAKNTIPGAKVGGRWLIPVGPLVAWLDSLANPTSTPEPDRATRSSSITPLSPRGRGRRPSGWNAMSWQAQTQTALAVLDALPLNQSLYDAPDLARLFTQWPASAVVGILGRTRVSGGAVTRLSLLRGLVGAEYTATPVRRAVRHLRGLRLAEQVLTIQERTSPHVTHAMGRLDAFLFEERAKLALAELRRHVRSQDAKGTDEPGII